MSDFENLKQRGVETLKRCGALLPKGHYILSSGKRSPDYVQIGKVQANPKSMIEISNLLAEKIKKSYPNLKINSVAAPAIGGIIPGYQMAVSLDIEESIFFERNKETNEFELKRSYQIVPGWNYLVVEDVVTTGGSFLKVAELITKLGGNVVLAASFVDRTGGKKFDYPFISLIDMELEIYEADALPDWLAAIPPVKPGSNNKPGGN